jgi:hypothetical protein
MRTVARRRNKKRIFKMLAKQGSLRPNWGFPSSKVRGLVLRDIRRKLRQERRKPLTLKEDACLQTNPVIIQLSLLITDIVLDILHSDYMQRHQFKGVLIYDSSSSSSS